VRPRETETVWHPQLQLEPDNYCVWEGDILKSAR